MSDQQRAVLRDGDEPSTGSVSSPPQDERGGEMGPFPNSAHGEERLSSSRSERSGCEALPEAERASRTTAKRWTPARQAAFLRALEETLSVSKAAKSVGMSRQSAYKLRQRMAGQPFAEGWERAVADLRLEGELVPVPLAGSQRCPVCGAAPARSPAPPPGRGLW